MILLNHLSWYLLIDGETVVIEEDEGVMDVIHALIVKECPQKSCFPFYNFPLLICLHD